MGVDWSALRRDTAGPASIDSMDVPARLWSAEGRRGRAPTIAGTVRRSTGQAVGEGRWDAEFTTRFSTAHASVRMRFKEMSPFFSRVLEPSAPTTLTSWGRHPVRTPTTVASHDSRTPVSGGRVIGIWCRWSWEGTFATPILVILGATSSADDHHRAVRRGVLARDAGLGGALVGWPRGLWGTRPRALL